MQVLTEIVDLFFLESTISLIDTTSRALVYEISAWTRARNSGKLNEQQKGFCTPRGAWLPQFILVQLVPVLFLTKTVAKNKKKKQKKNEQIRTPTSLHFRPQTQISHCSCYLVL